VILQWAAVAGGIFLVGSTIASVIGTFIVPRDTPARLAAFVSRIFLPAFRRVSRLFKTYEAKDNALSFQGPLFLLVLLATWLGLLVTGFALLLWAFSPIDITTAFREAGSSLFTLGFATTRAAGATAIDLIAAATGLIVVALLIGYLPVLYGAFNRRETMVTMLESRAGAPAWGPEILWRHQRIATLDNLPAFYARWEEWCADVAESHSTYPVLLFFRSPHPLRSWLTGLIAVLDSAALYNALCPTTSPAEARFCLRMGFTTLRTLAEAIGVQFDPDPHPDAPLRLSYEEYRRGVDRLVDIGFPMERNLEEAWPHFQGWRVNYEDVAMRLADRVVATPGPWMDVDWMGDLQIPTKRPVDRTPDEPDGTEYTKPGSYEER
jgi:hypothetical protein